MASMADEVVLFMNDSLLVMAKSGEVCRQRSTIPMTPVRRVIDLVAVNGDPVKADLLEPGIRDSDAEGILPCDSEEVWLSFVAPGC